MFLDPPLDNHSIEWEAPYIFDLSSEIIRDDFVMVNSLIPNGVKNHEKLSSVSIKLVRISDKAEIIVGCNNKCDYLISWGHGQQDCNEQIYKAIEQNLKNLIEKIISRNTGFGG